MGPHRALGLAAAVVTAALTACGTADDDSSVGRSSLVQQLDGRTFVLADLDDREHEVVPGSTIRLDFGGGELGVQAGCNQMSGQVSAEDGRLVVERLESTEIGCDPGLLRQEAWIADFLTGRPVADLDGASLTLAGDGTTLHLEEEVVEDAPLEGTVWRLVSLLDGSGPDGSVSTPPARATDATLQIEGDALTVDTGCNAVSARVEYADGVLRADEPTTTLRDCGPAMESLERRLRDVLAGPAAYAVEGRSLTLWSGEDEIGLGFRAG